eukprot:Nk52_evm62s210 gene=Nk52_evmTU62s210
MAIGVDKNSAIAGALLLGGAQLLLARLVNSNLFSGKGSQTGTGNKPHKYDGQLFPAKLTKEQEAKIKAIVKKSAADVTDFDAIVKEIEKLELEQKDSGASPRKSVVDSYTSMKQFIDVASSSAEHSVPTLTALSEIKFITGSEATAYISALLTEVTFIYRSLVTDGNGEFIDQLLLGEQHGHLVNVFGNVPAKCAYLHPRAGAGEIIRFIKEHSESHSESFFPVSAFVSAGDLHHLFPYISSLFNQNVAPIVFHCPVISVVTGDDESGTDFVGAYVDMNNVLTAPRHCPAFILGSASGQECHDMSLIAFILSTQLQRPFIHYYDGILTANEKSSVNTLTVETARELLKVLSLWTYSEGSGEKKDESKSLESEIVNDVSLYFSPKSDPKEARKSANMTQEEASSLVIENVLSEMSILLGSDYKHFEYTGDTDAEYVIIAMVSSMSNSIKSVVKSFIAEGTFSNVGGSNIRGGFSRPKMGLIEVRVFKPWSKERFLKALPDNVKRICIIDQTKPAMRFNETLGNGLEGRGSGYLVPASASALPSGPLFLEVASTLSSASSYVSAANSSLMAEMLRAQCLHSEVPSAAVYSVFENLLSTNPLTVFLISNISSNFSSLKENITTTEEGKSINVDRSSHSVKVLNCSSELGKISADITNQVGEILSSDLNLKICSIDTCLRLGSGDDREAEYLIRNCLSINATSIDSSLLNEHYDLITCQDPSVLPFLDVLWRLKENGTFVLNCPWSEVNEFDCNLPVFLKTEVATRNASFLAIDALKSLSEYQKRCVNLDEVCNAEEYVRLLFQAFVLKTYLSKEQFTYALALLKSRFKTGNAIVSSEVLHTICNSLDISVLHIDIPKEWHSYSAEQYLNSINDISVSFSHFENFLPASFFETHQEVDSGVRSMEELATIPYLKTLSQLFGRRLNVANIVGSKSIWGDIDNEERTLAGVQNCKQSSQYGYGLILALNQRRNALSAKVKSVLAKDEIPMSKGLREALNSWYTERNATNIDVDNVERVLFFLETERFKHQTLEELYLSKAYFMNTSNWLIGGDDWSYDISFSGIHQLISSGENINVLVFDTELYSSNRDSLVFKESSRRKKDIGLYAMNYGGVYVASVSHCSSYSQMLSAFKEADNFDGPSVVLAYAPVVAGTTSAVDLLRATKDVVDQGMWPLYRWNPVAEEYGKTCFVNDSEKIKKDMQEFLDRENQFSALVNATPNFAPALTDSVGQGIVKHHAKLEKAAKDSVNNLLKGLKAKPLLILYGSDGGHAEELAKRLETMSKCRNLNPRCMAMNDFEVGDLVEEEKVVFVVSTAGQGEFPCNARDFWKSLSEVSVVLENTSFAVFALGDRHYWPRPEDKHFFCKPGKDLDKKLVELGAKQVIECGIGDDQDEDGYETGFQSWEPELWSALGVSLAEGMEANVIKKKTDDDIKIESNFLRGTILEGLADTSTGALAEQDTKLTKFHGIYQQDDRDLREERLQNKMEKAYSFMIRVRVPGGVSTPAQYLAMDELADSRANGTIKLTTRQAYQLHGVIKQNLKPAIQGINRALMDTLAACGDVNRNVMCNPNPHQSAVHAKVNDFAVRLSAHLSPQTSAYHEIWLDKKMVKGDCQKEVEPLYGPTYLPRKFKIAIAIPPSNDVDVFAHCLGFIAIMENGDLAGFNVTVGGGMGMTHNNVKTYPCLGKILGFCSVEQAVDVAEKVMLVQRDFGDRTNRKHARLKYTVEDLGLDRFRKEVEDRLGYQLQEARDYKFSDNSDRYGWTKGINNTWNYCMFIQNGRIRDTPGYPLRTALREIAKVHKGDFRLTPNQHLILGNIAESEKPVILEMLRKYDITNDRHSGLRLNSMACVALPTCNLAFAESERYLPSLVTMIENILEEAGLREQEITIRMTGCANGCARPYLAELAFVGKAPGIYNMYMGASHSGDRLNKLYKESVGQEEILTLLRPIIFSFAKERKENETFGDFVIRKKYVQATVVGPDFHKHTPVWEREMANNKEAAA